MASAHALAKVPLFAELDASELERLARTVQSRRCRPTEVVVREGELGDCVYIILSGLLVASALSGGRSTTLSTMTAGEVFGEIAAMDGRPRTATVTALTDADLLALDRRDFQRLVRSSTRFGMQVMSVMADRLRRQSLRLAAV